MGMNNDQCYVEMLNTMREQGRKDNPATIQLGTMLTPTSVKLDDLILSDEDLYVASYCKGNLVAGDLVAVQRLKGNMFVILAKVVQL
jgi:hypothetical protein